MKKQPPPKIIFRDREGNIFAEYTLDGMKSDATLFPEDIRKKLTLRAIESAKTLGLAPRQSDLEKYGLIT